MKTNVCLSKNGSVNRAIMLCFFNRVLSIHLQRNVQICEHIEQNDVLEAVESLREEKSSNIGIILER